MLWFFGALGGLLLSTVSFLLGRVFSQSEAILADKRRVYESFLKVIPDPGEAYREFNPEVEAFRWKSINEAKGAFLLYAAPNVAQAFNEYIAAFGEADMALTPESPALHPAFKKAAIAQNNLILEMRRDALAWSAFAYSGKSRLASNPLELGERKKK